MVDETGLDEPKVDEMAVDEIAVDEPGPHLLSKYVRFYPTYYLQLVSFILQKL